MRICDDNHPMGSRDHAAIDMYCLLLVMALLCSCDLSKERATHAQDQSGNPAETADSGKSARDSARAWQEVTRTLLSIGSEPTGSHRSESTKNEELTQLEGAVDMTIGMVDGPEEYLFHQIVGIALDSAQRVYILDRSRYDIRVFSREGTFLFRYGRSGRGPGDLHEPCCITFDRNDVLWIRNEFIYLDAFRVRERTFEHLRRLRLNVRGVMGATHPLVWDSVGNLGVSAADPATLSRVIMFVDSAGEEVDQVEQPMPPAAGFVGSTWSVEVPTAARNIPLAARPPFGERFVTVYGPGGVGASVLTGSYHVTRVARDGMALPSISQDVEGPLLSRAERDSAARLVDARLSRGEQVTEVRISDRKPVVDGIWFDSDGRLWVEVAQPDDSRQRRADVYSRDGMLAFVALWPSNIRLGSWGTIRGDIAFGIRRDTLNVEEVVRLRFMDDRDSL